VVKKLTDAGMMTESYLFAPESMRISPALTITEEEIDSVCDEFISILSR
jgi:acetylornithine/succinyldiaminopimelate/putrescine aminotransferase